MVCAFFRVQPVARCFSWKKAEWLAVTLNETKSVIPFLHFLLILVRPDSLCSFETLQFRVNPQARQFSLVYTSRSIFLEQKPDVVDRHL